jgi:hypothetical protein
MEPARKTLGMAPGGGSGFGGLMMVAMSGGQ